MTQLSTLAQPIIASTATTVFRKVTATLYEVGVGRRMEVIVGTRTKMTEI